MSIESVWYRPLVTRVLWFLLLSLPVILFLLPFVAHRSGILGGDWDYFAQAYEAIRRSVLEYHQFPWWNPWIGGGVPLYANPQIGLISLQTPLILIFGTLVGFRISILLYFLLGFWGMRKLLLRIGADKRIGTLLSYIWVFSSFPVWHITGGHFTFTTYFLAPWFFYLLLNIRKPHGWLWFGLFSAFLVNQSLHYMTVHIMVVGLAVVLYQVTSLRKKHKLSTWPLVKPYVLSLALALPLIAHKLYFTFQYLHDFPRTPPFEAAVPINIITAALTWRSNLVFNPSEIYRGGFGWGEYTAYFGILTLGLLAYFIIKKLERPGSFNLQSKLLLAGLLFVLVLSAGDFGVMSPYGLMKKLPVFSQMQVSPRWLGWFVFGALLLLAKLPRKKFIVIILIISIIDVFASSYGVINHTLEPYQKPTAYSNILDQQAFYTNTPERSLNSMRLFSATQANIGDIYGYEPLVGFGNEFNEGFAGLSSRCATNKTACSFVLTNNAVVEYWSPNFISLRRTAPGNIELNQNPGSYWKVNGKRTFRKMEVAELKQSFVINDPSDEINLQIDPPVLYR